MSDPTVDAVTRILDECERYWERTRVPRRAAAEMRAELEAHLMDTISAGGTAEQVVGPDLAAFAEAWASEQRRSGASGLPSWDDVHRKSRGTGRTFTYLAIAGVVIVAGGVILALSGQGGTNTMEDDIWRWVWIVAAVVFGSGEVLTAGFFLLPFAAGAVFAAIFAWLGLSVLLQWIVFIATSVIALLALRTMVRRDDEQPAVGANRFINQTAMVIEPVERMTGHGRVRMETEDWRATTEGEDIPAGAEVRVVGVVGARLLVEPIDEE